MGKRYDVIAKTGEYKGNDGEMKARWLNCGVVLEDEKGMSLKIECVPAGNFWNGWFMIKPANENSNGNGGKTASGATKAPAKPQSAPAKPQDAPSTPASEEGKDAGELPF